MPEKAIKAITEKLPAAIKGSGMNGDTPFVYIDAEDLLPTAQILKNNAEQSFAMLVDISALDYESEGIEVLYLLAAIQNGARLQLRVKLPKSGKLSSLREIYRAAKVYEREIYDMFGIEFEGHRKLKRLFLPQDFKGNPLLKYFSQTRDGE